MKRILLLTYYLIITLFSLAQSLSKNEKDVLTTVSSQLPETNAFLEKVVNINDNTTIAVYFTGDEESGGGPESRLS